MMEDEVAVALGLLGAQLSIVGAILYQSHQTTGQSEGAAVPMIVVGLILGTVAVIQGRRSEGAPPQR